MHQSLDVRHRGCAHGAPPASPTRLFDRPLRSRRPVRQRRLSPDPGPARSCRFHEPHRNYYDSVFIESFWSSLKYEVVYHQRFATFAQARHAIFN
jgi:hypothetical protein